MVIAVKILDRIYLKFSRLDWDPVCSVREGGYISGRGVRKEGSVDPSEDLIIVSMKIFDLIPLKKEIKAEVSGLYIVGVKGIRGSLEKPEPKRKGIKGLVDRLRKKAS